MPPFGFWKAFRKGQRRARRGDVRAGILALLGEGPRNGYQIMQELEQRSRGAWRPSPGSVYPALAQLEDENLIAQEQTPAGRVYALTPGGKAYVKDNAADIGTPWETMAEEEDEGDGAHALVHELRSLGAAVFQLSHNGDGKQLAEAKRVLAQARKAIYGMLAKDTGE
jgi:DNA-binding PadR family transcriptional regulator